MVSGVGNLRSLSEYGPSFKADWSHATRVPDCNFQCEERVPWKRDVALEISVDVESDAATILLSGTLDGATAVNLVALVVELISEGYRSFELRTSGLCVATEPGLRALNRIHRLVQRSGGTLLGMGRRRTGHPSRNGRAQP